MDEITRILGELEAGRLHSTDELIPLVYDELRRLAVVKMAHEREGHTLDATALVHEAFIKLTDGSPGWESQRHFFAAAAEAMRRILIDRARARGAEKRGGRVQRAIVDIEALAMPEIADERVILLSEAIDRLAEVEPAKAELVKLRYFAGLTIKEAARILQISTATADRHWAYARAWLQHAVKTGDAEPAEE